MLVPVTRSLPHLLLRLVPALAVALCLCSDAGAQAAGGKSGKGGGGPNVFKPAGGGQYKPPGDAGQGGDDGGNGGGEAGDDKQPKNGPSAPAQPAGSAPGSAHGGGGGKGVGGSGSGLSGADDLEGDDDTWEQWWETNKFDFIELRRVQDAPVTPAGFGTETAAAKELRLAAVREHLRETVLPVLRELLGSSDDAVRAASAVALAKLRDEESLDRLSALLVDGSVDVRRSAMLALGVMDSGRGTWMLLHVAGDSGNGRKLLNASAIGDDERGIALMSSALRGQEAGGQLLLQILGDREGTPVELLALASEAAGLNGSTDAIRPLIDIAFDKSLPEHVRSNATSALGRIGDPSVTPALMELLGLGLEPGRAAALALGQVAHPGASKVIEKLTQIMERGDDAPTRHFAAVSLGRIGGDAARTALLQALAKGREDMRPWVAMGLGLCERRARSSDGVPALLARLAREGNPSTQAALLVALGLSRADEALPELEKGLASARSEVAAAAAMGLGLTDQLGARAPLRELLSSSKDPAVLRSAALGLGILGDSTSIPALLNLIRSTSNPFVASFAAIGVAFIGDADAAAPLLDLIQRHGPTGVTTTWAVTAVGQLFDEDRRPALARLAADDNYHVRPAAVEELLNLGF
jgi:HEAT repeat protein